MDTQSPVLAVPDGSDLDHSHPDFSRLDVHGCDNAADKWEGMRQVEVN